MPKCTCEHTNRKKNEIIDACAKLYKTLPFKDITIKMIGEETSLTRTSIYNYYVSKEEIFLALLMRDMESWICTLDGLIGKDEVHNIEAAADGIARSFAEQPRMLKLISMNLVEMQDNSRMENLIDFRKVYGKTGVAMRNLMGRLCPELEEYERQTFVCMIYPFMFGIYPYTAFSEKQKEATEQSGVPCCCIWHNIHEAALPGIRILLHEICSPYFTEEERERSKK